MAKVTWQTLAALVVVPLLSLAFLGGRATQTQGNAKDTEATITLATEPGDSATFRGMQDTRLLLPRSSEFIALAGWPSKVNVPATQAYLSYPYGMARDLAGNVYIADSNRHQIRKISTVGIITTIAGTGQKGASGDGGPALHATFNFPGAIAVAGDGALYVADYGNNRVRRIGTDGIVATVAGTGVAGSTGDGGPASVASINSPWGLAVDAAGTLFVSEWAGHRIRRVGADGQITTVAGTGSSGSGGDGGPATQAQLYEPAGLAVDGTGNLFVADSRNSLIRKISTNGLIETAAGGGLNGLNLSYPYAVAVSAAGELMVSDSYCRIYRVGPTGTPSVVLDDSFSCEGLGDNVQALVVQPDGSLLILDSGHYVVRKLQDGASSIYAGIGRYADGRGNEALFSELAGVSADASGNVYVADYYPNNRIRKISPSGLTTTFAGSGSWGGGSDFDSGPALAASLGYPLDTAVDQGQRLYIADRMNNTIRRVELNGAIVRIAGTTGAAGFSGDGGLATSARLNRPRSVAVGGDGAVYIADGNNQRVRQIGTDGVIRTFAGNGVRGSSGDGGPAIAASLDIPTSVAIGPDGSLYVAEGVRIRRVGPGGGISTVTGAGSADPSLGGWAVNASIPRPTGVAVDQYGRLLIAAGGLYMVDTNGSISQIKGTRFPVIDVAVRPDGALVVTGLGGQVDIGLVRSSAVPAHPEPRRQGNPAPPIPLHTRR